MEHGLSRERVLLQFAPVFGAGTFILPVGQRHQINIEMVSEFTLG
jgi:hypothetical protein